MSLRDKPFQVIFKGKGVVGQFLPCKFFLADSICRNIFRNIPLAGIFLTSMFFHIFLPQATLHELIIQSQTHRNSYGNSCCVISGSRTIHLNVLRTFHKLQVISQATLTLHWYWNYLRATFSNKIFVETGLLK